MQVPNVLNSLRNNENPSFAPPIQWSSPLSEWKDDIELYGRLKTRYLQDPTADHARHWSMFMDTLRPIDWHIFLDFFTLCPRQHQTPTQLEVSSKKRATEPSLAGVQLLYAFEHKQAKLDQFFRVPKCLVNMDIETVQQLAQHVWQHSSDVLATKHLPARLTEFLNAHPHGIQAERLQANGAGLLLSAMLLGVPSPSFAVNIGEDEHYYERACKEASNQDVRRLIQCFQRHPAWQERMNDDFEIVWFEHFLKKDNPHHLEFGIYQSLDPSMDLKQLLHFLNKQNEMPPEQYSLESISIF